MRVTHLPTGLVADVHHERSQHKNNALAMRLLAARLWAHRAGVGGREMVRNYVLDPYQRVHDPRTGAETPDAAAVLDGGINPFLAAWVGRAR